MCEKVFGYEAVEKLIEDGTIEPGALVRIPRGLYGEHYTYIGNYEFAHTKIDKKIVRVSSKKPLVEKGTAKEVFGNGTTVEILYCSNQLFHRD